MTDFHSFSTLIKRLEEATSRLEDYAVGSTSASTVQSILGDPADSPPDVPAASATAEETTLEIPLSVTKFDELTKEPLKKYVDLSKKLDVTVAQQSGYIADSFHAQRDFILTAARTQKVDLTPPIFTDLFAPTQKALEKVGKVRERHRNSEFENHLSTVHEGGPVLAWSTVVGIVVG
ncbi:adenylate cyclase-associated CAP [Jimgerdemannia flammicorona]|uniref:Adenylate cyclase-associated CAP n=1 Tax=Jimgerdemannia flammicorona TaxID=994334 RepID=A0A433CZH1_9FUNG|nr:adenylate cyclase-associated CAP [Jimgerdemannia flammicorona]